MIQGFRTEVIADSSGNWAGNALVFATEVEAARYVADLASRWTLVRETRVVPCGDAPNYRFDVDDVRAVRLEEA